MRSILSISIVLVLTACFRVDAQSTVMSDSSMKETLTRAVQCWKEGKAKDAFISLDSINEQMVSAENANTKIKASVWTANYLMAQRKNKPASPFLDSALRWAENTKQYDELIKVYETYSDWHLAVGNPKTAFVAKEAAWTIKDSLSKSALLLQMDSLQNILNSIDQEKKSAKENSDANDTVISQKNEQLNNLVYILGGVIAVLVIIIFMMNGNLQRLRTLPPSPLPDSTLSQPRTKQTVNTRVKTEAVEPVQERKKETIITPPVAEVKSEAPSKAEKKELQISNAIKDITSKLAEVELVLIKADVLANYKNGESKPIRNLLNEYMAQLPFIMKTLDDAITLNEKDSIINSLEHLKTYLVSFGMQSTMNLIDEIEKEAETQKVAKLLSRVFQVRNHCRRAADEAKSLLEKVS
ncbi:MAG: hypothetical protein IPJ26_01540 [Bacteroidetes bacterium]|nr:hypothetical protein [Bacteroidota bacterium]